jgi:hypothetical protein
MSAKTQTRFLVSTAYDPPAGPILCRSLAGTVIVTSAQYTARLRSAARWPWVERFGSRDLYDALLFAHEP